jgi:hypothetical protein
MYNVKFIFNDNYEDYKIDIFELVKKPNQKCKLFIRPKFNELIKSFKPEFKIISDFFDRKNIDKNFKGKFYELIKNNVINNLKTINKNISCFKNIYKSKNQSAILVGAGPSLDLRITEIKKYKNKLVICSVDAALPVLIKNDIAPDFVFNVDPQSECMDFFKNYKDLKTNFIYALYSNYKLVNKIQDNKYYFITDKHKILNELIDTAEYNKNCFLTGGSTVSMYALEFLCFTGIDNIGLIGQDFGFNNNLFYSKQTVYYDKLYMQINKFVTLETDFYFNLITNNFVEFNNVYTLNNLKNYLFEFEFFLKQNNQHNFYNLSYNKILNSTDISSVYKIFN